MDKKKQLKKILDRYPMLDKDRDFILECACGCNKTIIDITLLHTQEAEYITVTDEQINDIINLNAIFYINYQNSSISEKHQVTDYEFNDNNIVIYANEYYSITNNKITFSNSNSPIPQ